MMEEEQALVWTRWEWAARAVVESPYAPDNPVERNAAMTRVELHLSDDS